MASADDLIETCECGEPHLPVGLLRRCLKCVRRITVQVVSWRQVMREAATALEDAGLTAEGRLPEMALYLDPDPLTVSCECGRDYLSTWAFPNACSACTKAQRAWDEDLRRAEAHLEYILKDKHAEDYINLLLKDGRTHELLLFLKTDPNAMNRYWNILMGTKLMRDTP